MTGTAKAFQEEIEYSMGMKTWDKIVKKIHERYNITIEESITDFPKFHTVLREMFGNSADKIEKRVL